MIFKIIEMYRRYEEIKKTKAEVFDLMNEFEFTKAENEKLQKIENVVMLVPVVYPNLGGVTSALRILTSLQNKGCKLTLAVCSEEMTMEEAKKILKLACHHMREKSRN